MRIREYTSADLDSLHRMHAAQGFGYPFPDLDSPLFVSKLVLEDNGDEVCDWDAASGRGETGNAEGREAAHRDALPQRSTGPGSPRVVMAVLLRLTAEAYLLHVPAAGTPRLRWQRFVALHDATRASAAARGLDDVQAFLPPRVAQAFGRRLTRLGWAQDPWPCFSQRV